jgi:hypothetical protein
MLAGRILILDFKNVSFAGKPELYCQLKMRTKILILSLVVPLGLSANVYE